MLQFSIRQIPPKGLEISEDVPAESIGLSLENSPISKEIKLKGLVERVRNYVLGELEVSTQLTLNCARCLEPFERQFEKNYRFEIEISGEDDTIDLGDELRQELIMDTAQISEFPTDEEHDCQSMAKHPEGEVKDIVDQKGFKITIS